MLKEITRNFKVDLMKKMQKCDLINKTQKCECPSVWESIHFAEILFFKMTGGKSGYYLKILQNVVKFNVRI